jgi:prolyl oligopeptidase
VKPGVQ